MMTGILDTQTNSWAPNPAANNAPAVQTFNQNMGTASQANPGYVSTLNAANTNSRHKVRFGLVNLSPQPVTSPYLNNAYLGGATIQLTDPEPPTINSNTVTTTSPGGPDGWAKDGHTFTFAPSASDPGLGVAHMYLNAPTKTGGTATQTRPVFCTGGIDYPCLPNFTLDPTKPATDPFGAFRLNTTDLPEGTNTTTTTAKDMLGHGNEPGHTSNTSTKTIKVDRTAPTLVGEPTGTLYENRNRTDDHRREGLYDNTATIRAEAKDDPNAPDNATTRSGVKTLELWIDKNRNNQWSDDEKIHEQANTGCTTTQCPNTNKDAPLEHTLDLASLSGDGDYKVKVIGRDLADNAADLKEWTVTVDRQGNVYNGRRYLDGVAGTGAPSTEEWSTLDQNLARKEARDETTTMTPSSCDPPTLAASCLEWRSVGFSIDEPRTAETFTRQMFGESDPNIERVGVMVRQPRGTKSGEGPIASVAEPWQTLPPARSSAYELYESTFSSETAGGEPVTRREYVDRGTKLPIHVRVTDEEGMVVDDYRWTYAKSRKSASEYPAAHFKVERPSTVTADSEIQARSQATPGSVSDTETNSSFTSVFAGPSPSIGALRMCLSGSALVRQYDSDRGDTFPSGDVAGAADPPLQENPGVPPFPAEPADEPPIPGETVDLTADPYGPMTWVDTTYRALDAGQQCVPGAAKLPDESPLSIRTLRRTGSLALSARRAHVDVGEAVALDPTHEDSAFSGKLPVVTLGGPSTAYLVRVGEDESSALVDVGEVTLILSGTFTKTQLPTLANSLEEAQ